MLCWGNEKMNIDKYTKFVIPLDGKTRKTRMVWMRSLAVIKLKERFMQKWLDTFH